MLRLRSQDTETGRVDVIFGNTTDKDEFLHRVFVGNVAKLVLVARSVEPHKERTFHATRRRRKAYVLDDKRAADRKPYTP